MITFDFPFHQIAMDMPMNSTVVQFGGGYQFAAPPEAPPQRVLTLTFPAMRYFVNTDQTFDRGITVVANQTDMLALTGPVGTVAYRSDEEVAYRLKATPASTVDNWELVSASTSMTLDQKERYFINIGRLDWFYSQVGLSTPFTYPYPPWGPLVVRFKTPMRIPKVTPLSNGLVEGIEVQFIEQP